VTKETERVFRLTKERQTRKIDACVAASFAILGALEYGRPVSRNDIAAQKIHVNTYFNPRAFSYLATKPK
jgi:hypothetical protein